MHFHFTWPNPQARFARLARHCRRIVITLKVSKEEAAAIDMASVVPGV